MFGLATLLDVLRRLLDLDFVNARLNLQPEQPMIEAARFAPCAKPPPSAWHVGEIIEPWLTVHRPSAPYVMPHPFGRGPAIDYSHLVGTDQDAGVVSAAAPRIDFPSKIETLLMRVAVNQARHSEPRYSRPRKCVADRSAARPLMLPRPAAVA